LPQSAGNFQDVGSRKKYVPAPPLPPPFLNERYITDVGPGSQFVRFYKGLTYQPSDVALALEERFIREAVRPIPSNAAEALGEMKAAIAAEMIKPISNATHLNQEVIALGTGSAVPCKTRNGKRPSSSSHK
jgi:hypothetical protein